MRKLKEILRLKYEAQLSIRQITRSCSISHSTVSDILHRAETAGLSWPLSNDYDENKLEALFVLFLLSLLQNCQKSAWGCGSWVSSVL